MGSRSLRVRNKNADPQHQKTKWATFTYSGKAKKITKLFKETQINVAFRTRNTIQYIVKPHSAIDVRKK
jgi:hypothetical protein